MNIADCLGFGFLFGFGFWWLVFPRSVIALYAWFHRDGVGMPKPIGIRIAGALWIVLVLAVLLAYLK